MCPSSPGEPLSSCHRKSPAHNNYQVAADLGEEHSFPIPGQAVTPRHTSQPPSPAGGRVTAPIRGNGAKERGEASSLSSSDAPPHGAWSMWKFPPPGLLAAFYSHTITITLPWSLLPFPHPGPRLIETGSGEQGRGTHWWYIMMRAKWIKWELLGIPKTSYYATTQMAKLLITLILKQSIIISSIIAAFSGG